VRPCIADLADAAPDVIADLRKYCKAITGVRASHYKGRTRTGSRGASSGDLERLLEKGEPDLLIEEPPALGGFGFAWTANATTRTRSASSASCRCCRMRR
jgi:hypothetical protein